MSIHPIALLAVVVLGTALVFGKRETLLAPFLFAAVFIPLEQGIAVAGVDLTFARLLLLAVWLRMMFRGELKLGGFNSMDRAFLIWCVVGGVAYVILWGSFGAIVNRIGHFVNYAGTYFLVRHAIRSQEDMERLLRYLRLVALLLGATMMVEWFTRFNVFAVFGGAAWFTQFRDGVLRCRGPFGHPIVAGVFAASLVPIFLLGMRTERPRFGILVALLASVLVVASTGSSGPVLACAAGVGATCLWPFRRYVRMLSWGVASLLLVLHLVMDAPVWALLWRVSVFGASTGWHRFNLFDQFIRRVDEWWLVGTHSTAHWGAFLGDVANNYVRIGVDGGIFTLIAFLFLLRRAYVLLGRGLHQCARTHQQALFWSLGCSLTVHVVGSFGVSYWDQIVFLFAILLGSVSALSQIGMRRKATASETRPVVFVSNPVLAR